MSGSVAKQREELEQIAAKLLQVASMLPQGPERHDLLKEIGKIRSQLFELKAKGK
jgi:capsule polysaccharide export protein KpsE/RkpR